MEIKIKPKKITRENFSIYGELISKENIKPMNINNGYAKRFDNLVNVDFEKNNGRCTPDFAPILPIVPEI